MRARQAVFVFYLHLFTLPTYLPINQHTTREAFTFVVFTDFNGSLYCAARIA